MEAGVSRVIILGGLGLFGRTVAEQLRNERIAVEIAARRAGADIIADANDAFALRSFLRSGDLVVDAAGPFQARSTALVETAIDVGCDIVDLNDSVAYAEKVLTLEPRIAAAGIRVLSGASTVSAVAAAVIRQREITNPQRVAGFLAPATRYTANAGAARSLIASVGRNVRVWRDGRLQSAEGWSEPRTFPMSRPVGSVCGRLFETADAVYLPRIWPTLREVTMHVDPNTPGLNLLLRAAGTVPGLRSLMMASMPLGTWIARKFGASAGGIGYEIEDADGNLLRSAIVAEKGSQLVAVAPAVLAARAILAGQFDYRGLVPPDRHVDPTSLIEFLRAGGITYSELESC